MTLSVDQKKAVTDWVAAGASISDVQKRLREEFKVSLTYMDTRFVIDDLGLALKTPAAPKAPVRADLNVAAAKPPAGEPGKTGERNAAPADANAEYVDESEAFDDASDEFASDAPPTPAPAGAGSAKVEIDRVMRPGSVVSGTVTFSDGNSGKWALDQYGRLVFDGGKSGYRPSQGDLQAFQRELSALLQRHGY
jgi:hypothetical protein